MRTELDAETCSALIVNFWGRLDQRDYNGLLDLMSKDARWERGETWLQGREAILNSLNERPKDLLVRHLITNAQFRRAGDILVCDYYVTVLASQGHSEAGPAPISGVRLMGDAQTQCRLEGDAVKISEVCAQIVFEDKQ
ncbi:MAG: nuclear transport factor 2 family protein [Pseudomonadota bacterium]